MKTKGVVHHKIFDRYVSDVLSIKMDPSVFSRYAACSIRFQTRIQIFYSPGISKQRDRIIEIIRYYWHIPRVWSAGRHGETTWACGNAE